jgi:glycerophosphoryl diester phosphodiesterase
MEDRGKEKIVYEFIKCPAQRRFVIDSCPVYSADHRTSRHTGLTDRFPIPAYAAGVFIMGLLHMDVLMCGSCRKEEARMVPLIYAHRGASGHCPENTMEAFRKALKHRADGIELDVQLTRDEQVVVIHDHFLDRTTDGSGPVQQYTLQELQQFNAGTWFHPRFQQVCIPSFEEVCAFLAPTSLRLIVELKNFFLPQPGLEEKVLDLLRHYHLTERTIISSFNFDSLLQIKKLDGRQTTALLYVGNLKEPWVIAKRYRTQELHAPRDVVNRSFMKKARREGFPVLAWTVNGPRRLRELFAMKVDGVVTNYPLRARKIRGGEM